MQARKGDLGQDLFVTKQTARKSQLEIQDRVNKESFFFFSNNRFNHIRRGHRSRDRIVGQINQSSKILGSKKRLMKSWRNVHGLESKINVLDNS